MKLSLTERIQLVKMASQQRAAERLRQADKLTANEPPDDVKLALESYAKSLDADNRFRADVKFAIALAGGIVFLLALWWTVYILNGGLL